MPVSPSSDPKRLRRPGALLLILCAISLAMMRGFEAPHSYAAVSENSPSASADQLTLAGFRTGETVAAATARLFPGVQYPVSFESAHGPYQDKTVQYGLYLLGLLKPIEIMGYSTITAANDPSIISIVGDGAPYLPDDDNSDQWQSGYWAAHMASTIVLVRLTFDSSAFDDLERAAIAKYGKPSKSGTDVLSNAMGAKFNSRFAEWTDSYGNKLTLRERAGRIDRCEFELANIPAMQAQDSRIKAQLAKSSGL